MSKQNLRNRRLLIEYLEPLVPLAIDVAVAAEVAQPVQAPTQTAPASMMTEQPTAAQTDVAASCNISANNSDAAISQMYGGEGESPYVSPDTGVQNDFDSDGRPDDLPGDISYQLVDSPDEAPFFSDVTGVQNDYDNDGRPDDLPADIPYQLVDSPAEGEGSSTPSTSIVNINVGVSANCCATSVVNSTSFSTASSSSVVFVGGGGGSSVVNYYSTTLRCSHDKQDEQDIPPCPKAKETPKAPPEATPKQKECPLPEQKQCPTPKEQEPYCPPPAWQYCPPPVQQYCPPPTFFYPQGCWPTSVDDFFVDEESAAAIAPAGIAAAASAVFLPVAMNSRDQRRNNFAAA